MAKTGESVFAKAHLIAGAKWGGFSDKLSNLCYLINKHFKAKAEVYQHLMSAQSLEDQTRMLSTLDGLGMFTAYEITTDMSYSKRLGKFSLDDWA